jgi:hypothetical protein
MMTTKNKFGLLHSYDDQPSLVDDNGSLFWHENGKLHRVNGLPCIEMINGDHYYTNKYGYKIMKKSKEKHYNLDNRLHRIDGPAYEEKYVNDVKKLEIYYIDGDLHRENGPAYQEFFENGKIKKVFFCNNGHLYRTKGPTYQEYNEFGVLILERRENIFGKIILFLS